MNPRSWRGFARPGGWTSHGWDQWPGGFPWVRAGRFFGPGEVRLALLALLEDGPKHGYELMKALEDRTGGFYRASAGTVYPTLQQLEDEGLVVSEPHDGKRVYRLTDAGRRELGREAEAVRRIFHRVDSHHEWRAWGEPEMGPVLGAFGDLVGSIWRTVRAGQGRPETLVRIREILVNARREVDGLASPGVDTGGDGERREQPG